MLRSTSARRERTSNAREELLDFLESWLVKNGFLPRYYLYQTAAGLAARRDIGVSDLYRPIALLHELLFRVRRNPGLQAQTRVGLEQTLARLVGEFKQTEGVELLADIEAALARAHRDYNERERAWTLIKFLARDWTTEADLVSLRRLVSAGARLRKAAARDTAAQLVRRLKDEWAALQLG